MTDSHKPEIIYHDCAALNATKQGPNEDPTADCSKSSHLGRSKESLEVSFDPQLIGDDGSLAFAPKRPGVRIQITPI